MRADKFFAEKFGSRTKAATAINEGRVLVNGKRINPSCDVNFTDNVQIIEAAECYVSRGGYKLAKALRDFGISVRDMVFADIGASNGGFTDCLFQNGAKKVYCIDVGESQLDESLLQKNVVVYDNYNARNLTSDIFQEPLDGIVIDVSFISLTYILGAVGEALQDGKTVLALVKPQFECGEKNLGKNGIVKDPKARREALIKIYNFACECGLAPVQITSAPIIKGKNIEYIFRFLKGGKPVSLNNIIKPVNL